VGAFDGDVDGGVDGTGTLNVEVSSVVKFQPLNINVEVTSSLNSLPPTISMLAKNP